MYVALKVLEQHLDPNTAMNSNMPQNSSSLSGRGSAVISSLPQQSQSKSTVMLPIQTSSTALPDFNLPRSILAELPSRMQFFKSSLPYVADDVVLYPTSRVEPRRECLIKV